MTGNILKWKLQGRKKISVPKGLSFVFLAHARKHSDQMTSLKRQLGSSLQVSEKICTNVYYPIQIYIIVYFAAICCYNVLLTCVSSICLSQHMFCHHCAFIMSILNMFNVNMFFIIMCDPKMCFVNMCFFNICVYNFVFSMCFFIMCVSTYVLSTCVIQYV